MHQVPLPVTAAALCGTRWVLHPSWHHVWSQERYSLDSVLIHPRTGIPTTPSPGERPLAVWLDTVWQLPRSPVGSPPVRGGLSEGRPPPLEVEPPASTWFPGADPSSSGQASGQ